MSDPTDDGDERASDEEPNRRSSGDGAETLDESDDGETEATTPPEADGGRREVEVPMALYKRVTVFGTLIAVVSVLLGFVLLDAATLRGSRLREWTVAAVEATGVGVPGGVLSAAFALLGLGAISLGAGVYVLSTRFRTAGMGKSKDRADEDSDNG